MENDFSKGFSTFFGVALPWLFALPALYMPNVVAQFINFTSLVFVTFANFVVPLAVYAMLQRREEQGSIPKDDPTTTPHGVHVHHAIPPRCQMPATAKATFALIMSVLLTIGSVVAIVLTVQQGTYTLDQQACALVGS